MLKRYCSNLQIVRPDYLSNCFKLVANFSTASGTLIVEGKRCEGTQEQIQLCMLARWIRTSLRAITKFVNRDGTEDNIAYLDRLPTCDKTLVALSQKSNARISVGEKDHSKERRFSNSP